MFAQVGGRSHNATTDVDQEMRPPSSQSPAILLEHQAGGCRKVRSHLNRWVTDTWRILEVLLSVRHVWKPTMTSVRLQMRQGCPIQRWELLLRESEGCRAQSLIMIGEVSAGCQAWREHHWQQGRGTLWTSCNTQCGGQPLHMPRCPTHSNSTGMAFALDKNLFVKN